jgi:hypothetical protein
LMSCPVRLFASAFGKMMKWEQGWSPVSS